MGKKIDGQCTLKIDEDNKEEKLSELSSQIYCHLSISLFDNFIEFLNNLNKKYITNSEKVIDKFGKLFEEEIKEIDNIKIAKTPFIHILHSLRLCRNCITHNYSRLSNLEKKFESHPELNIEIFCYQPNETLDKIFLDQKRFKGLIDLYSQLAYLAYICCCTKNGISLEI